MNKRFPVFALLFLAGAMPLLAQKDRKPVSTQADKVSPHFPGNQLTPPGDQTPPEVLCLNGLAVNIMPSGLIQLWANDFLASVTDNITPPNLIQLAVRKAGAGNGFPLDNLGSPQTSLLFDCDEEGIQQVELWARDQAGNASFCLTSVEVKDQWSNCNGFNGNLIACSFQGQCGVAEILYQIDGADPSGEPFTYFDISEGCTAIHLPEGSTGTLTPYKDDNPLNGVSQFDWVIIKNHILGIQPFTSPYQWIAADINGDRVLDLQDSIDLSRLLLGIYTELPDNTSWRFVPKNYVFPSPNPLAQPFPESVSFQTGQVVDSIEFVAVKIGDVNGTAFCNNAGGMASNRFDEPVAAAVQIWPNPTQAGFSMQIQQMSDASCQFRLFDIRGQLVYNQEQYLAKGEHQLFIPAEAMPNPGLYFWHWESGESYARGQVIREE